MCLGTIRNSSFYILNSILIYSIFQSIYFIADVTCKSMVHVKILQQKKDKICKIPQPAPPMIIIYKQSQFSWLHKRVDSKKKKKTFIFRVYQLSILQKHGMCKCMLCSLVHTQHQTGQMTSSINQTRVLVPRVKHIWDLVEVKHLSDVDFQTPELTDHL